MGFFTRQICADAQIRGMLVVGRYEWKTVGASRRIMPDPP